jgi:hypothetical protein
MGTHTYSPEARNIVPSEPAASVVREMFERYASGEGLSTIAAALNGRGVPSKGKCWYGRAIGRMLENDDYIAPAPAQWRPSSTRTLWRARARK